MVFVSIVDFVFLIEVIFIDVGVYDFFVICFDDGIFYVFGLYMVYVSFIDLVNWIQLNFVVVDNVVVVVDILFFNIYGLEVVEGIDWVGGWVGLWVLDVIQLVDGCYYFYYNYCVLLENGECVFCFYLGVVVLDDVEGLYEDLGLIVISGYVGDENLGINGENYDGNIYLNVIDLDVFFDKEGCLWMVYGFYFGGIWIMEMDF